MFNVNSNTIGNTGLYNPWMGNTNLLVRSQTNFRLNGLVIEKHIPLLNPFPPSLQRAVRKPLNKHLDERYAFLIRLHLKPIREGIGLNDAYRTRRMYGLDFVQSICTNGGMG